MDTITRKELMGPKGRLLSNAARLWLMDADNVAYVNRPMKLFGSSVKVEKGSDKRDTYIMYLQPAGKVSKATLCIGAEAAGCEAPCLISSGQLGMSTGQRAATKRTILMVLRPQWFEAQLLKEIDAAERKALKGGVPALFRLNGTSDCDFSHIMAQRPLSAFYDYTKVLGRIRRNTLPNYHLTFSGSMYSTQSKAAMFKAVQRGYNMAVAYNTKGLKDDVLGLPDLTSFDTSDLRPLDSKGAIGYLKRKGSNKAQRAAEGYKSFFVTAQNVQEFNNIIAVG